MQNEKYQAADCHRQAADQKADNRPAQAPDHKQNKTELIFVPKQINRRKPANGRQPINSVILHSLNSHRRNRLNFNLRSEMQIFDGHNRPRRFVFAQNSRICFVYSIPQFHLGNVNRHLQNVIQIASGFKQNLFDVSQSNLRLRLD